MHMTFVTGEYPPDVGGVADYTYHLAHAVVQLGYEASVVTTRRSGCDGEGVRVHQTDGWRVADVASTARTVSATRPDVVNLQYVPQMYGRAGIAPGTAMLPWLLRRSGVRVVSTMHEVASPWSPTLRRAAVALAHRLQAQAIVAASDRVVATNRIYARQLRRWAGGRRPVCEIPVGAGIVPAPVGRSEVAALRSALGGDGRALVGEFSPVAVGKQPEALIALARALGPSARLVLLGGLRADDERRHAFERSAAAAGISDRIIWSGRLSAADASRHLAALDVYVHTHVAGASPRSTTLASALAHGLPVVAFDGPETTASLRAATSLLPSGDIGGLVRRIASMLDDADWRGRLSAKARSFYERESGWDVIAGQLMEAVA